VRRLPDLGEVHGVRERKVKPPPREARVVNGHGAVQQHYERVSASFLNGVDLDGHGVDNGM
jgi:hypothetical protein